jgi:hypothetical protein
VTLNTAKSKSIAQVKPDDINCLPPSGNALLNGYQVVLNKTTNSYTLSAICNGTPDALSNATTKLYGITFDLSTFVPASATKMTVTFTILNGGVTSSNGNVNAQRATSILLKGATGVTPKTIIITAGGLIE